MAEMILNATAVADFEKLLNLNIAAGYGLQQLLTPIREFCDDHCWDWFTRGKRPEFNRRCAYLYQAYSYGMHSNERRQHLAETELWIYCADTLECPGRHQELDGLILPRAHPFWQNCYPPLDPTCSCYVAGANTERAAARLGGKIGKTPPAWSIDAVHEFTIETLLLDIMNDNLPPHD